MKTNQEHIASHPHKNKSEKGNALIYVLIAIGLFAALSFTLSRQTSTGSGEQIDTDRQQLYATQMISTASQLKSAIDQMLFSGSSIADLNFTLPGDTNFETGSHIHKVYHPLGGGITPPQLASYAIDQTDTDPVAGWYMGSFNNIDWTESAGNDVILVAYQIPETMCGLINEKITGNTTIPALVSASLREVFIDGSIYSGANSELTTSTSGDICEECNNMASLCVSNPSGSMYAFYTVVADQ